MSAINIYIYIHKISAVQEWNPEEPRDQKNMIILVILGLRKKRKIKT